MRLGIDIGGTKTAVVLLDGDGRALGHRQAPSGQGSDVVGVAVSLAREVSADAGGVDLMTSVGACIPGVVDPQAGTVRHAVNLGLDHLDLARGLGDRLGHPVVVENDVKAAAIGAHLVTGADEATTFGYLNVGTGLAAAVIRGGRLDRGPDGLLGEIGHVPVGGSRPCSCGQTGCLETTASGTALAAALGSWAPGLPTVLDLAAAGDPTARAAIADLVRGIRIALQLLVVAAGAARLVVGGGLTGLGPGLDEALWQEVARAQSRSHLLASLDLRRRTTILRHHVPLAAIGAAALPSWDVPVAAGA